MVTAHTLAFGGFLLLGDDRRLPMGRKRAFLIGLVGFAAASALGGVAMNAQLLFSARALQGVFAALLAPAALALITVTFHDPEGVGEGLRRLRRHLGGGAAIGLLLGGVLTEYFSWRWCAWPSTLPSRSTAAGRPLRAGSRPHGDIVPTSGSGDRDRRSARPGEALPVTRTRRTGPMPPASHRVVRAGRCSAHPPSS